MFLLPGYNYNYMNDSLANQLRNNFVGHGKYLFFLVLKPIARCRQLRCLGWIFKLLGGQKISF